MLVENSQSSDALSQACETVDGLMAEGQYAKSLGVMLPYVESGELDLGILERTADCFFEMKDYDNAIAVMSHITKTWPEDSASWGKLGVMLQSVGNIEGATHAFETLLRSDPNSIPALTALNGLQTFPLDSVYARRLLALSEREDLDAQHQALVLHALGQVAHVEGEYDAAFSLFQSARDQVGGAFVPAIFEGMVEEQLNLYRSPEVSSEPTDKDGLKIVFVGGMPMSGCGLVNRILSKHSNVVSIGESAALSRTHGAIRMHLAKTGRACSYWDWIGTLTEEEIDIFRQYYLERALGSKVPEGATLVDAHPMGCLEFALAKVLFPDAKFVFLSRHPLETGLANIATNVLNGSAMAAKPEWIAQVMKSVYTSAQDYAAKLGGAMHVLSYDALVNEPEAQIAYLLHHAGLELELGCLSPAPLCDMDSVADKIGHEELDPATQNQWKAYAEHLQPLLEALGGQSWIDQWAQLDKAAQ